MKFDRNKAFPYPVLRPHSDDFVDKQFQATPEVGIDSSKVAVEVTYALSSRDIRNLIKSGAAAFVSIIACRDTFFSVKLTSVTSTVKGEFEATNFRGEVEIRSYIQIVSDVTFVPTEVHPDFGSGPLSYTKGDIIAQDETNVFYFDRDLFKSLVSVFDLVKRESLTGGAWEIKFDDDHIQIEVSPEMKEALDAARNRPENRAILLNSILFATVMQALDKIKTGEGIYDDYRWAKVIKQTAHNKSISLDSHDSYLAAEKLMGYPLSLLDAMVFKKGAE